MKKKNLLTLGALVLSLGLTVTSCAGAKGEDGAPGKDGTNGTNGKDGKDGADGKTYIAVIDLGKIIGNVKVKQSAYFIEPGESVTFTFEPSVSNGAKEVLTDLELNGEVVEEVLEADENGVITWTWNSTSESKGAQLTGGLYTDVDAYGTTVISNYIAKLQESDPLLLKATEASGSDYAGTDWTDTTFIDSITTDSLAILTAVTDKFDDDDTVSEKLSAVKAAVKEAEELIDSEYADLIADAKVSAKEAVASLNKTISSSNYLVDETDYSDTDSAAIVASVDAEIDAATSLLDIAAVINATATADGTSVKVGSFNTLVSRKLSCYYYVNGAYSSIVNDEAWLKNDTAENKESYKKIVSQLEALGLTVDTLPGALREEYVKKISAATSLDVYTSGNYKGIPKLALEGYAAITNCVSSLKEAIAEKIEAQYLAEITSSSALKNLANVRATLTGVIEQAVSDYQSLDSTDSHTISSYLSSEVPTSGSTFKLSNGQEFGSLGGLQGFVEYELTNSSVYTTAFNSERLVNAFNNAVTAFKAQIASIKAADKEFAKLNGGYAYSNGNAVGYVTLENLADDTDAELANPFVTGVTLDTTTIKKTAFIKADDVSSITSKTTATLQPADDLDGTDSAAAVVPNVDIWFDTLYAAAYNATAKSGFVYTGEATVAEIQSWQEVHISDFKTIYEDMISTYATAQKGKLTKLASKSTTYITDSEVTKVWDNIDFETFDGVTSAAVSSQAATDNLVAVDKALVGLIGTSDGSTTQTGLFKTDLRYLSWLNKAAVTANSTSTSIKNTNSKLYKDVFSNGIVSKILAGTATTSDVKKWCDNVSDLYDADCAARLTSQKEVIEQAYQNKVTDLDPDKYEVLKGLYTKWFAFAGHIVDMTKVSGTTGAFNLGKAKIADSVDLSSAVADTEVNSASHVVTLGDNSGTSSKVKHWYIDLRGENFTSVDLWRALMDSILENAGEGSWAITSLDVTSLF